MTLTKTRLGTNEDGSPQWLIQSDKHVVYTGPHIRGTVTLPDGTIVDVTEDFIEVETAKHAIAVSDAIGRRFEAEGHPAHDAEHPFVRTPSSVTHNLDGTPSRAFADKVHEHAVPGKDSSPAGVIAALKKG